MVNALLYLTDVQERQLCVWHELSINVSNPQSNATWYFYDYTQDINHAIHQITHMNGLRAM